MTPDDLQYYEEKDEERFVITHIDNVDKLVGSPRNSFKHLSVVLHISSFGETKKHRQESSGALIRLISNETTRERDQSKSDPKLGLATDTKDLEEAPLKK